MSKPPSAARMSAHVRLRALGCAVLLALLSLVLTALPSNAASGTPAGKAWVRAAHLVPGLGAARIDLVPVADGSSGIVPMSPSATYGHVTTYRQQAPGDYQVQVRLSGAAASSSPMLSRTVDLAANKAYTLAVLGTAKAPRLEMLSDDLTPPAAGAGRVRLLLASNDAPTFTVSARNGPTIASNAVLGQASAYATVPAGTWTLDTTAGSQPSTPGSITLAGGSVYTLLVLDGSGGKPRLDLITDAAGTAAAPTGGAQTGGGGTATQFVATTPSHWPALPDLALAVLASGLAAGGLLLIARRRGFRP